MNKKIFTLLMVFLSLSSFSHAKFGEKYIFLVSSDKDTLTWTRDTDKDKITFKTTRNEADTRNAVDFALWKPQLVKVVNEDSVFQFVNKATKQLLSFSTKKNKENKFSTEIASGVNEFVFKSGEAAGSPIYAFFDYKYFTFAKDDHDGKLIQTTDLTSEGMKFKVVEAPIWKFTDKEDLTGSLNTFRLVFDNIDQKEIFTRNELIPTKRGDDTFCFQILGEENSKKGSKPQYITVDTVSCIKGSVKAAGFMLDTVVQKGTDAYKKIGNAGLQNFRISMDLGNDAITLEMDQMVTFDDNGIYDIVNHKDGEPKFLVGYKTAGKESKLVVDDHQIEIPFITLYKGTPVKLPNGTGVYSLKVVSDNTDINGKYYIGGTVKYIESVSVNDPSTQVFVKENENGTYSMQVREGAVKGNTAYGEDVFNGSELLYAVDKSKNLYRLDRGDTLEIQPMNVDINNEHIGYKHFTKKEIASQALIFSLPVKNGSTVYWSIDKENHLNGTIDEDEAVELRLYEGSDIVSDTIFYGADKLGDKMYRVAYAISTSYEENNTQAYLNYDEEDNNRVGLIDKTPKRYFVFKENKDGGAYKIITSEESGKSMITMNQEQSALYYAPLVGGGDTYFELTTVDAPTYNAFEPGVFTISSGSNMLTSVDGVAKFMHPETKALDVTKDFQFYIDTAYINRGGDNIKLGYYIYVYDSYNKTDDKVTGELLSGNGIYKGGSSIVGDSAVFRRVEVVADSVYYSDQLKDGKPVKETVAKNKSVVCFKYVNDGECHISLMNDPKKVLVSLNGVLFFNDELEATPISVESFDITANEEPEVPSIKVITGKEQITVVGAAGKKMNVYNILGQMLVNKVLSSDNETLTLPSGVVVINIENEESVKAVVR